MISDRIIKKLELDKILSSVSDYAVLYSAKQLILDLKPETDIEEIKNELKKTKEATLLLYKHGVNGVSYYDELTDELLRAKKGGVLSLAELLKVGRLLKSSLLIKTDIDKADDEEISYFKELSNKIYIDTELQNDIFTKIISNDELSDNASPELYRIRKQIVNLNERIKLQLNSYVKKGASEYIQDNVVTMRNGRYVIPVKAEYKNNVKGLIHDQSASGATVFIEPEAIVKFNNDLATLKSEEKSEIYKILSQLSAFVGNIADFLSENQTLLSCIDMDFARAIYSFKNKCHAPEINSDGVINIINGRHPLIDKDKVVPVTVKLGNGYKYLLITGPNTGGKTVTLKLTGLLTLMALCGLYIPASEGSEISVFEYVFTDIGDEQSIEQNLSTFSSHVKNIIYITKNVNEKSLVLIDEIGAGTDPEEGASLGLAVLEYLLKAKSSGIITTHYSQLKEFAMTNSLIENASMDFNPETFAPLYKLNIGVAGSSNAIEIAKRLGISDNISKRAYELLSSGKTDFENILREAQKSKHEADKLSDELAGIEKEKRTELEKIEQERVRLENENAKIREKARIQTKKLIDEKLDEAQEILDAMNEILSKDVLNISDKIKANALKKKLENVLYTNGDDAEPLSEELKKLDENTVKEGQIVYIPQLGAQGAVSKINLKKHEADVVVGNMHYTVGSRDLYVKILNDTDNKNKKKPQQSYSVKRTNDVTYAEINVIGQTVLDGVESVDAFISSARINGYDEIRIIHGNGTGALRKGIHDYLKHSNEVEEFRLGGYGEGGTGATIVKLKK